MSAIACAVSGIRSARVWTRTIAVITGSPSHEAWGRFAAEASAAGAAVPRSTPGRRRARGWWRSRRPLTAADPVDGLCGTTPGVCEQEFSVSARAARLEGRRPGGRRGRRRLRHRALGGVLPAGRVAAGAARRRRRRRVRAGPVLAARGGLTGARARPRLARGGLPGGVQRVDAHPVDLVAGLAH